MWPCRGRVIQPLVWKLDGFLWLVPIHGWTHVFNWLWRGVFKIDFQILENYY